MIRWLQGKKTFITAATGFIVAALTAFGILDSAPAAKIGGCLLPTALVFLKMGSNAQADQIQRVLDAVAAGLPSAPVEEAASGIPTTTDGKPFVGI